MLFDTHVHFDGLGDDRDCAAAVERAREAGVTHMVAVGGSADAQPTALAVAARFPEAVRSAVGFDRDQAEAFGAPGRASAALELDTMLDDARHRDRVVAIGEIGLDYHYSADSAGSQVRLFREQLELAARRRLPVIVHSREADADTLELLETHAGQWSGPEDRIGVLHCFTGTGDFARRLLALGYCISFSGIVTFKNAEDLRNVVRAVPEDRILVETDSPLLAPVPYRGKRNEPAYLPCVVETVAGVRGVSVGDVGRITSLNAARLFGWPE